MTIRTHNNHVVKCVADPVLLGKGQLLEMMHLHTILREFAMNVFKIEPANLAARPPFVESESPKVFIALPLRQGDELGFTLLNTNTFLGSHLFRQNTFEQSRCLGRRLPS